MGYPQLVMSHMEKEPCLKRVGVWKTCPYCQGKHWCLFCGDAGGYYVARLVEVGDDTLPVVATDPLPLGDFSAMESVAAHH